MPLTPEEQFELDQLNRELEPEKYDVHELESAARGLAQGATLGFADEAAAGVRAGWSALTSPERLLGKRAGDIFNRNYETEVAASRERDRLAREQNSKSYMAGDIVGNVASSLVVPGVQAAKGVGLLSRLGKSAAGAAAESGLQSYGSATQFDAAQIAKDAAIGGALGGAVGGAVGAPRAVTEKGVDLTKRAAGAVADYATEKGAKVADVTIDALDDIADASQRGYKELRDYSSSMADLYANKVKEFAGDVKEFAADAGEQAGKKANEYAAKANKSLENAYTNVTSGQLDEALKPIAEQYGPDVAKYIASDANKSRINMLLDVIPKKMQNEADLKAAFDDVAHPFYTKQDAVLRDWARRNNINLKNPTSDEVKRVEQWAAGDARDVAIREFESGIAQDVKFKRMSLKGLKHPDGSPMTRESRHAEAVEQTIQDYRKQTQDIDELQAALGRPEPTVQTQVGSYPAFAGMGVAAPVVSEPIARRVDAMIYDRIKKTSPYNNMSLEEAVEEYYKKALETRNAIRSRAGAAAEELAPETVNDIRASALNSLGELARAKMQFVESTAGKHFVSASVLKPGKPLKDFEIGAGSLAAGLLSGSFSVSLGAAGLGYMYNRIQKDPSTFIRFLNEYKSGKISAAKAAEQATLAFMAGGKEARQKLAEYGISKAKMVDAFKEGFEKAKTGVDDAGEAIGAAGRSAKETVKASVDSAKAAASDVKSAAVGAAKGYAGIAEDAISGAGKAVVGKISRAVEIADKIALMAEQYGPKAASAMHKSMMEKDKEYRKYVEQKENEALQQRIDNL